MPWCRCWTRAAGPVSRSNISRSRVRSIYARASLRPTARRSRRPTESFAAALICRERRARYGLGSTAHEERPMTVKRINSGPRMSSAVVHNGVVYVQGFTADDVSADLKGQTKQILAKIDAVL